MTKPPIDLDAALSDVFNVAKQLNLSNPRITYNGEMVIMMLLSKSEHNIHDFAIKNHDLLELLHPPWDKGTKAYRANFLHENRPGFLISTITTKTDRKNDHITRDEYLSKQMAGNFIWEMRIGISKEFRDILNNELLVHVLSI